MEKARENVRRINEEWNDGVSEKEHSVFMNELKPDINNLLHTYLPENTTLKETECLAITIFDMITNPDSYLQP